MKTIFLVCGQSGSGKDSLVANACKTLGLNQLKSYATRPRRTGEGNTHTFITPDEVAQYEHEIIAYTKIGEFEYFATKSQLETSSLYIIDYEGIKWMFSRGIDFSGYRFVTIFINLSDATREKRAINGRSDNELVFYKRCFNENVQFNEMLIKKDFDYAITNRSYTTASTIFNAIIVEEMANDD